MTAKIKPPLITTIIPTYQRPERLRKAIQSVLNQTFQDFQVCIYDNASGDSTAEVVAEFIKKDLRVKYHCHERDIGAPENFLYGISRVDTPYFSILSDDDYLFPEFYETTLNGFKKHPDAGMSLGAVIDVEDSGEVIKVVLAQWPDQEYFSPPQALYEMIGKYSNWIGSLFRTELIRQVGELDLSIKAMDVDFSFRVAARFPVVISKRDVAVFVSHAGSYSKDKGLKLLFPGFVNMIANLSKDETLSAECKIRAECLIKAELEASLFRLVLRSLELGNNDEALKALQFFVEISANKPKKLILLTSLKICKLSQFSHWFFACVCQLRRSLKRYKAGRNRKICIGN